MVKFQQESYYFGGERLDKNGNKLPQIQYVQIKDMDTDHIKACLATQKQMNQLYKETMETELIIRTMTT
mgnify:FL=1